MFMEILKQQELPVREGTDVRFYDTVVMYKFGTFVCVVKLTLSIGWNGVNLEHNLFRNFMADEMEAAEKWYSLLCNA